MDIFLLLPNNLFDYEIIKEYKDFKFILYEHPLFFSDKRRIKQFHIKKIILHRESMMSYYKSIKSKIDIVYIEYNEKLNITGYKLNMFNPCDKLLEDEFKYAIFHENPLFYIGLKDLEEYKTKTKRDNFLHNFKNYFVNKFNIPFLEKSYDTENRLKLSDFSNVPEMKDENYLTDDAIKYAERNFKTIGNKEDFNYPTNSEQAKIYFKFFLEKKLIYYGDYQDSIDEKNQIMYHSNISSSMNIGIITPKYIIETTIAYYKKNKSKINIKQVEGFLRQIIGWREYMRYIYNFYYDDLKNSNYFNNNKKIPITWYNKDVNTEILPVDNVIKNVFRSGYMNHIERLAIILNFFTLNEIDPNEIYKWFMTFSIDAYDWVMVSNIGSMGYSSKIKFVRKPYLFSSNYILKMSTYKRDNWCKVLDDLFYKFILKKEEKLEKTIYKRNIAYIKKKGFD